MSEPRKFSLTIKIPNKKTIENLCQEIKSGKSSISYNEPLAEADVKKIITAFKERKEEKKPEIRVLNLDSTMPTWNEDQTSDIKALFEATKNKVGKVSLGKNTISKEIEDLIHEYQRQHKSGAIATLFVADHCERLEKRRKRDSSP